MLGGSVNWRYFDETASVVLEFHEKCSADRQLGLRARSASDCCHASAGGAYEGELSAVYGLLIAQKDERTFVIAWQQAYDGERSDRKRNRIGLLRRKVDLDDGAAPRWRRQDPRY